MLRRSLAKLRSLLANREAVFLLQVAAGFIAILLFGVAFLDATLPEVLIVAAVLALTVPVGYAIRYLLKW